jgi:hypothetical protein
MTNSTARTGQPGRKNSDRILKKETGQVSGGPKDKDPSGFVSTLLFMRYINITCTVACKQERLDPVGRIGGYPLKNTDFTKL